MKKITVGLKQLSETEIPMTENLGLRIDRETKTLIEELKTRFGRRAVARFLRNAVRAAVEAERVTG